jgi:colicin import membrane protein
MSEAATESVPAPQGTGRFFSQEELNAAIENARKQEKDKLYPAINKTDEANRIMQEELKELQRFKKAQEKVEADRVKAIEDAQKAKEEAEMSAKDFAARQRAEMEARVAQIQAENEQRIAVMEQEVRFSQLQAYIQRRVVEEQGNIVPELVDFITGDNQEQVEASIELLKAKSAQIAENVRNLQTQQRTRMPGVAPSSGTNGVTQLDQPGDRQLSADDIRGMSMAEFAQLRKKINMPSGSGRGLFD